MEKSSLRVCIDIRPLETGGRFRGYGYYVFNLVLNVLKTDRVNNYIFLAYSKNPLLEEVRGRKFEIYCVRKPKIKPRFWWLADQATLPRIIKRINPDIYVSLDNTLPFVTALSGKIKTVNALHDLVPLVLKKDYRLPIDRRIDFYLKIAATKRADMTLTISNYSKRDIAKYLHIPNSKIKYIYESTDKGFSRATEKEISKLKRKYTKGKRYIMTVGDYYGRDPRKNYLFLLDGFYQLIKEKGDLVLLMVGKCGGKNNEYSKIRSKASDLGILDKVVFTDFVSNKELAGLYSGSESFVYPTKYEGFGLPILQAMSCGCPVVAANNTSIPEVAGTGAELFATDDQRSFLNALSKVMSNRGAYIRAGYENIKRFSWEKSAREFISLLDDLGANYE